MAAAPLKFHGLLTGISDGRGVRIQVVTPSDQVREIPLDRDDVMRILKSSLSALELLDREAARQARHHAIPDQAATVVHEADIMSDTVACGLERRDVEWTSVTTRTTCRECIGARG